MYKYRLAIGAFMLIFSACNSSTNSTSTNSTLYVDSAATGKNDGSRWADAFRNLQDALAIAQAGQHIWVAKGEYFPTADTDRSQSFDLVEDVEVYGGFAGNEARLEQRNWEQNLTILSGNIGDKGEASDNSQHVVVGADGAVLDGFVIQDGYAIGVGETNSHLTPEDVLEQRDGNGGGLLNFKATTTVRNTVFRDNAAMKGGGVFNMTNVTGNFFDNDKIPVFINVTFENNYAVIRGGAMSNDYGTNPIVIASRFSNNRSDDKGGAMYNDFSASPIIVGTVFNGNTAISAAAMGNDGTSSPVIVDSTFTDNVAVEMGAALYQGSYNANLPDIANTPTVIRSTIENNRVQNSGFVSVFNWGDSWVFAYDAQIEGWPHGEADVPERYQPLVALAERLRTVPAQVSDLVQLQSYIPQYPKELGDLSLHVFGTDKSLVTEVSVPARIFHVDAAVQGGAQDGSSWPTAFSDLQAAINAASAAGGGEVWVAQGVYAPTAGTDRTQSFEMRRLVAVYGGFTGTETALSQRDWQDNSTLLSGDIGKIGDASDNAYHVIKGSAEAILDGFTVRDGNADGEQRNGFGGGMFNWGSESAPIVRNTVFTDNQALDGGGVFNFGDVLAYFYNVEIKNNRAALGGGITARFGSSFRMEGGEISGNTATYRGGGAVVNYGSNAEFLGVTFTGNSTEGSGGAVWVDDQASQYGGTRPHFDQGGFLGNTAAYYGGAIDNYNNATTFMTGNTFAQNQAPYGADVANRVTSKVTMTDNTLDPAGVFTDATSQVMVGSAALTQ